MDEFLAAASVARVFMMLPHPASGEDVQDMVVALGIYTEHWSLVQHAFPGIHNCCIDVARAFRRESDEDLSGSGFDLHTRVVHSATPALGRGPNPFQSERPAPPPNLLSCFFLIQLLARMSKVIWWWRWAFIQSTGCW